MKFRSRFFLSALFLVTIAGSVPGQTVTSVEFHGNSRLSSQLLRNRLLPNASVPLPAVIAALPQLIELYHEEGFYSAAIDSPSVDLSRDSTAAALSITIVEGPQTLVDTIIISGTRDLSEQEIRGRMETAVGEPLSSSFLESDIDAILHLYARRGHPFAAVKSDGIRQRPDDPSKLIVQLTVEEGAAVALREVRTEGTVTTSPAVAAREARIVRDEPFDQDRMDRIRRRLERLQLFSSVSDPQLVLLPGEEKDTVRAALLLSVKEGNTTTFDGVLGYLPPPTPGGAGTLTGNILFSMRNLFGTGRRALVRWQRENARTQELELQYREPWVAGIPLTLGASFFQRKQDSSFVKTRTDGAAELLLSDEFSLSGTVQSESVVPSADLQQFSVFASTTLLFGGEILYDTRDDPRNSTSGVRYSTSVRQGTKKITGPEQYLSLAAERNSSVRRLTLDAESYLHPWNRHVVLLAVHGRQVTSSRLEVSDLFPLGGANSLRGYRESQFFASQFAYITAEYRFLTGRASSFFGFFDGGTMYRPSDAVHTVPSQAMTLYGYGAGARIETGLGIMNVTFALGKGDGFSNGKIHVGIQNDF